MTPEPEDRPLLEASGLVATFGRLRALDGVELEVWPGEAVAVVGESGSGKTTLLRVLSGRLAPASGRVRYRDREGGEADIHTLPESARRRLIRADWGFVHQEPERGLRMGVSAGGNIAEPLMTAGDRHYGRIRAEAEAWLARVEIDPARIDDPPAAFSGGMRQRLQIARSLVARPRLVFMDEPTGGLDVSVQARLLDLLRGLIGALGLSAVVVTHDLAVARMLAERLVVMRDGRIVETGLADQVLDDPQHPWTQRLTASVLAP